MIIAYLWISAPVAAKVPPALLETVRAQYQPADMHEGLDNAAHRLEPGKLRGFAVVVQGGLPAGRADWFITNTTYDYHPSTIDVQREQLTTRRGRAYTYLQTGQVMIVADVFASGNTIYCKLLSADVPTPTIGEQHPSRLAAQVGFKFPEATLRDSSDRVLAAIDAWLKPFPNDRTAYDFAKSLTNPVKKK